MRFTRRVTFSLAACQLITMAAIGAEPRLATRNVVLVTAGGDYPKKDESQKIFLDFFGDPADPPRRHRPGVYDAKVYGPEGKRVQVIMLDTRYFRSSLKRKEPPKSSDPYEANPDPKTTILGEAQWRWLGDLSRPTAIAWPR